MSDLFIFLDESGNLDFSERGTKHWVLTSLITDTFGEELLELYAIRHRFIEAGVDLERFHASEDRQVVRDEVFNCLSKLKRIRVDSAIIKKCELDEIHRKAQVIYPMMLDHILRSVLMDFDFDSKPVSSLILIMDRLTATEAIKRSILKASTGV